MRKKFFILILAIITLISLMVYAYNPKNLRAIKDSIPEKFKKLIVKTIYFIPEHFREIERLKKVSEVNEALNKKITLIEKRQNLINEEVFPQTQFLKLKFNEITLENLKSSKQKRYGFDVSPFYIGLFDDKIIFISNNGSTGYTDSNELLNKKKISLLSIKNNLPKDISITDSLIYEGKIYITFVKKNKHCSNINIVEAKINFDKLIFKDFYIREKIGNCDSEPICGRTAMYNVGTKDTSIIISMKDEKVKKKIIDEYSLDFRNFKFCVIKKINIYNNNEKILSIGHRNPQGLMVNEENIILSTEHGPRGGDEINKIIEGKNYGWPIASYGEDYFENFNSSDKYKYKKNHLKNKFEDPIFSFTPSIGISQIIKVPDEFSKRWQNDYLVTSLKTGYIFRVTFDVNFSKIINMERIVLGKRIRDISYSYHKKLFLLALENGSGSLGVISVE
ncbi:PQQ-dependent sugar dehydrogenase [Candidatus Pelagibacter sp.]|uniref:PQQ-dependent sugar dehydrogenase n=1 Tax=Candidatus Pelagibacter sp. TaxID=2024849 RepID=UPI003D0DE6F4